MLYMPKIKRICGILLCALLLAGCASGSASNGETIALPENVTTNYKTMEVTRGTFEYKRNKQAKLNCFVQESVKCEYDQAILKADIAVNAYDTVKAGDVIATVIHETSDAQLARLELAYEHAVDSMESGISNYYQRIASIQGSDESSYYQRMQVEYELGAYQESANQRCEQALEELEEYRELYNEHQIVAPFDGIVYQVNTDYGAGDEIPKDTQLILLVDPNYICIEVEDELESDVSKEIYLASTPGMKVSVGAGRDNFDAMVTSTPNVVRGYSENGTNSSIFVSGGEILGIPMFSTYSASFTIMKLENMITVPKTAVTTVGTKSYVEVLENGAIRKQYVILGPEGTLDYCILDGLTEGQLVVVD